jgi:polyribonucleotide nucleotidyltransferase
MDNVMMVEGDGKEIDESELIEAIKIGHDAIKVQIEAQHALAKKVGDKALIKREFIPHEINADVLELVKAKTSDKIYEISKSFLDKFNRKEQFSDLNEALVEELTEEKGEEWMEEHGSDVSLAYGKNKKEIIRRMVLEEEIRLDGRKTDVVRPIWTEIGYLPSTHGSAIFTRGETQALTTLTLGTKLDEKMVDTALDHYFDKFFLHYNFPALSVGEIKPMRGPGRREIGHAALAARSLKHVLPDENPYTIRLVTDVLESNGSSSMATVCSGSMALMDGGIKIKAPVSGIAMGMISDGTKIAVLSDILGDEDALGDMDFKVTGTAKGITGCQMDIKIDGLPYETLEKALLQAKEGRLHILNEMAKSISEPAVDLKDHAPRIVEMRIDKSFIGAVIGSGGKVIQELQEVTSTTITIEEVGNEGVVKISSNNKSNIDAAVAKIEQITHVPEVGNEYDAKVASVMPYGVFVDFYGQSGLLHVSEVAWERINDVSTVFKEGDDVRVKLIGIDPKTKKFRLSRKVLLEKPEGYVEREPRERGDRGGDRRGGRRDDRRVGDRRDNRNRD